MKNIMERFWIFEKILKPSRTRHVRSIWNLIEIFNWSERKISNEFTEFKLFVDFEKNSGDRKISL